MSISFMTFLNNLITMPSFLLITVLLSIVMFANGCSDVPNAIATCVATRSLDQKKGLILSIVFNLLGLLIMTILAPQVAEAVFNIANFENTMSNNMIALSSALIGIIFWAVISWIFSIPTSQSHALISSVSGAAIALTGSFSSVNFGEWKKVLIGLVFINLLAYIVGFLIAKFIEKICKDMDRRKTNKFFKKAQIFGAASMCFMNGAQDGQKFIAIFLLGLAISTGVGQTAGFEVPMWLIFYCIALISLGTIIGGVRIIKTAGTKVAKVETYQGTAADISSAMCLFISSVTGIPVSSTHTKNSAVMGVASSRRLSNVNWKTAKNMFLTWIFTFPCCGALGFILTRLLLKIF